MTTKSVTRHVGEWGQRTVAPGEAADVTLTVSTSYSGAPIEIPVHVWRGERPGPAVFITGAVHGDEINGTGVIRQLILERPFDLEAGTLVLVPVVNILAFDRLSRYSPDRRDLNRSFPGKKTGSLTSRLARVIRDEIVARCDYGIDLHTAATRRTNYPNVRVNMKRDATARLSALFAPELVLSGTGPAGSLRRVASKAGCPTLILEAGEVWKVEPAVVEYSIRGIRNVLIGLDMLTGEPHVPAYSIVVEETKWMRAQAGGFLQFHAHPGDLLKKGDRIATNTSLVGQELNVVTAPADAILVGITTMPAVSPGDVICNLAFPSDEAYRNMEQAIERLAHDSLLSRLHDDLATNVLVSDVPAQQ